MIVGFVSVLLTLAFVEGDFKSENFVYFFLFIGAFLGCLILAVTSLAGLDVILGTGVTQYGTYTGYAWTGYGWYGWGFLMFGLGIVSLIKTFQFRSYWGEWRKDY